MRLLILPLFFPFHLVFAQVSNDNAAGAIQLKLGEVYSSRTDHCTVETACVDESLTGKCVEYHNDQWFWFNSGNYQALYINIFNQQCRDLRGVQLIVFKGTVCEPETYEILTCVSLETQDDIHTRLNNLETNQDYWLIIDGYLEDYCRFQLQVGEKPLGISQEEKHEWDVSSQQAGDSIHFSWQVTPEQAESLAGFRIFRKKAGDFRYSIHQNQDLARNAYGEFELGYHFHDWIETAGTYQYLLAGIDRAGAVKPAQTFRFTIKPPPQLKLRPGPFEIDLNYNQPTILSIRIYDEQDQLLEAQQIHYHPQRDKSLRIDPIKYLARKIYRIKVEIITENSNEPRVEALIFAD